MSWNWFFSPFLIFWSTVELHVNNNSKTKLKLVVRVSWCHIRDAEERRQTTEQLHSVFHTQSISEGNSIIDQNKFGGASSRSCKFTTTSATRAWSFAFTGVLEESSNSVAMWLCHSCHLEQQLTCHLLTTNCTPGLTEKGKGKLKGSYLRPKLSLGWCDKSPATVILRSMREVIWLAGCLGAVSIRLSWCDRLFSLLY